MYTISSEPQMAAEAQEKSPTPNITLRLEPEQFERYLVVLRRAQDRNPLINKSIVIRELLELTPPHFLKEKDIAYFRGRPLEMAGIFIALSDEEKKIVKKLANSDDRPLEEEARELVLEALLARGEITDRIDTNVLFLADRVPKMVKMNLLGEIAAGEPIEAVGRNEKVEVPDTFVKPGRDQFVLRARGNSMIDEGIHDGSLIVCDSTNTAKNGDMVVALIDGDQATVKKFYKEKTRIRLQPANTQLKPIYVEPERLQIQGIVVGIIRHKP